MVGVEPVVEREKLYATVIGTDPVRESSTTSTPQQVCEDVVVQERMPERDGNVGGTVAVSYTHLDVYKRQAKLWPAFAVQASGGVREAADVEAAREAGCAGIVLGRALLEGCFALPDVLSQAAAC